MVSKKLVVNDETNIVVKKRGRKSKKELESNKIQAEGVAQVEVGVAQVEVGVAQVEVVVVPVEVGVNDDNINVIIEDNENDVSHINSIEHLLENDIVSDVENNEVLMDEKAIPKKRGRKPKGGKIIQQVVSNDNNNEIKPNVILHLKCSLKDLNINSLSENDIQSYNFSNVNQLSYDVIIEKKSFNKVEQLIMQNENSIDDTDYDNDVKQNKEGDIRDIWKKLKILEHNLHTNNISDKKSACFWCTCDFDNPPVYIPKHNIKETYHVYGCFCSPECATAYLMEEHIDSSSKFERYHLMNHIYTKIYDYTKNIKPAPNPYYMLDKYYGNLNIQEYRSLLRNERLFLVVDKPLTRILPELHEDNDDFIINNKIIPSNTYQIKKKLQKKQTKNTILSEHFGLNQ
jgi:hypothetical protein